MTTFKLTKDLKLIDGNFTNYDNFSDLIYEYDGAYTLNNESMVFDLNGKNLFIKFTIYIEGTTTLDDSDDWYTPTTISTIIDNIDIDINSVTIDNIDVDLTSEYYNIIIKLIKSNL